jgi:hypothetical protein
MRVYCSLSSVVRFAFWTVLVGVVLGVLLVGRGTTAQLGGDVERVQYERGCVAGANALPAGG